MASGLLGASPSARTPPMLITIWHGGVSAVIGLQGAGKLTEICSTTRWTCKSSLGVGVGFLSVPFFFWVVLLLLFSRFFLINAHFLKTTDSYVLKLFAFAFSPP